MPTTIELKDWELALSYQRAKFLLNLFRLSDDYPVDEHQMYVDRMISCAGFTLHSSMHEQIFSFSVVPQSMLVSHRYKQ